MIDRWWELKYYVSTVDLTHKFKHGISYALDKKIKQGEVFIKPERPFKHGYTFVYWEESGSQYDFSKPVFKDLVIKAKFIENKIDFNPIFTYLKNKIKPTYEKETLLNLENPFQGFSYKIISDDQNLFKDNKFIMPIFGDSKLSLTFYITKDGYEEKLIISNIILKSNSISIKDVKNQSGIVSTRGKLTGLGFNNVYFIEDYTAGIAVYLDPNDPNYYIFKNCFEENKGKVFSVTGFLDNYSGLIQIKPIEITLLSDENINLETVNLNDMDITNNNLNKIQAKLVNLNNFTVESYKKDYKYNNTTLVLINNKGEKVTFYHDSRVFINKTNKQMLELCQKGKKITIKNAVIGSYNNKPQLGPSYNLSIIIEKLDDREKLVSDVNNILIPNYIDNEESIILPIKGSNDTIFKWKSSNEDIINSQTGEVILPINEEIVKLTLTATNNKEAITKSYDIKVISEKSYDINYIEKIAKIIKKNWFSLRRK